MKTITLEDIRKYNPCESGWKNLLKHYPKWKGTLFDFMFLENIPPDDKVWLFCRKGTVSEKIQREFALIVAEIAMKYTDKQAIHNYMCLLHLFYVSNDLDFKSIARSIPYSTSYFAARSAADSAADSTSYFAAKSAADSAADFAAYFAADSAADSTSYFAARSAAGSAADSAAYFAADSAAYFAADSAAYSAAGSAAYSAAYSAAESAARIDQVEIIKNLLEDL